MIKTFKAALTALAVISAPATAAAHGVEVFTAVEGDVLRIEARFESGAKASAGAVAIFVGESLLATLSLAPKGEALFPLTDAARPGLKILVNVGQGHGASAEIPAAVIEAALGAPAQ